MHLLAAAVALLLAACASPPPVVETYPYDAARWITVDGVDVHYFDFNHDAPGVPIVWVHGYSGTAFETVPLRDALAPDQRLIALDLPGSGYSEKPEVEYTLDYLVGALRAIVAELGLERYALVGHSMGGLVTGQLAAERPRGLAALILVAPYGLAGEAGVVLEFLADTGVLVDWGLRLHNETVLEIAMRTNVFHDTARIPADLVDYLATSTFHTPNAVAALASVTRNVIAVEHDPAYLERIEVPTLIIWGAEDRVLDFRYSAAFNRRIPGSELQAIPDSGHLPHVEQPEITVEVIREFLSEVMSR